MIRRRPDHEPEPSPKPAPPKQKTLRESGIDVADPAFDKTPQIIDGALQRNQRLAPYVANKFSEGFRIAEKGKFVLELTDTIFDDSYRSAYDLSSSTTVDSRVRGFYDPKKSTIHLRPGAAFGTALHEAIHRLASPSFYSFVLPAALDVSADLFDVLKEGLTAYFTDLVLNDEGLGDNIDAYRRQKKKAVALVTALGSDGFDLLARLHFKAASIVDIGVTLGLSKKEYGQLKGGGPKEVLKRLNALL